jgi:hypothetical protein
MVISSVQRPNVWIDKFKNGHNTVDRNAAGESKSADSESRRLEK